jgi:hypothetical protein
MLNVFQFEEFIVAPALNIMQMYSKSAVELMKFTCATESLGGTYVKQIKGQALGIFQMEPATYTDLWHNAIFHNCKNMSLLSMHFRNPNLHDFERMVYDLRYAAVMCRLQYARFNEALPHEDDITGLWEYYKKYWNTEEGKATKDKSIKHYLEFTKAEIKLKKS